MAQSHGGIIPLTKAEERKKKEEELKSFLELTSAQLVASWTDSSDRDHEIMYKYLAPSFSFDFFPDVEFPWPRTRTLKDFIAHLENVQSVNPAWRMRAYNFSTVLDTGLDNAVVWWTSGPSGNPGNESGDWSTNRESVSKLKWRKRSTDGGWECFGIVTIRGGSSIGDFD